MKRPLRLLIGRGMLFHEQLCLSRDICLIIMQDPNIDVLCGKRVLSFSVFSKVMLPPKKKEKENNNNNKIKHRFKGKVNSKKSQYNITSY